MQPVYSYVKFVYLDILISHVLLYMTAISPTFLQRDTVRFHFQLICKMLHHKYMFNIHCYWGHLKSLSNVDHAPIHLNV